MASNQSGSGANNPSLKELAEALGPLADRAEAAGANLDHVGIGIGRMQTALSSVQSVLQGVSTITQIAHLALGGFSTAVQGVANQIGGLVKLVNPGVLDRFQKSFAAFQAQLGETFLPVLVGLTGLVQTVANALAGLSPQGRLFIVFLAGAAAGLTAGVTAGGIFIAIIGTVAGGLIAGSLAAEAFSVGLDAATAGFAAIGAVIGAVLSSIGVLGAAAGGASAGGFAALGLAAGGMEKFKEQLEPFLKVLIGAFDSAGAALLPAVAQGLKAVTPALTNLFEQLVQYLPLLGELLVEFGANILPPIIDIVAELLKAFLPFATVLVKLAVLSIGVAGLFLQLAAALVKLMVILSPAVLLLGGVKKGQTANAESPVTSASYTGIEDLFKKSQEGALAGKPGEQKTFEGVMTDQSVVETWAGAIGRAVAAGFGQVVSGGSFSSAMVAAGVAATARSH